MGIPSHSTLRALGKGLMRAGAVPRAGVWHWEPQPVAHTPWGLDGCHQLHTRPGTAAVACPELWPGTHWALPGGSWASTTTLVGIGEGWQGCTCVWRGAGQPTAGETALVFPGAVPVISAAVGAGSSSPLGTLPWAEPGFGCREGAGFGMQPAWPHCPWLPHSAMGATDPWGCPRASSAWHGDLQDTSPGSASTQRVQQLRVQHFSPEWHVVSL